MDLGRLRHMISQKGLQIDDWKVKQFWIGTPKVCVGTMIIPWMGFILSQVHKRFYEIGHSFNKPFVEMHSNC